MMLEALLAASLVAATPPAHPPVCEVNPGLCRSTAQSVIVPLSPVIAQVNREVNAAMTFRSDVGDVWSPGELVGDCDEYVFNKRAELVARGVPVEATRIALFWALSPHYEGGAMGHAVLLVETDAGVIALDNPRFGNPTGRMWSPDSFGGWVIETAGTEWRYVRPVA